MSTTSQKHANFVAEPMGEKEVTECAGIGPTYAKRLEEKGYTKAYQLLAQYLLFTKDEEMFQEWLKDEISMKGKHLKDCSTCISEWSRAFM
ncbi:Oidioi.mRNA.OKI2018_I69.PAR.g11940.t1.cds [Oikopleura dioica]|uniref:Oidioi.mRNA.OKI2018_I69.PAR.g11940.t1.cds n=1 Tax=Oikopleura dioica TaxID=34765 RepID=A0ABN7S5E5_OIKDI|nr:Oidioi.mRNA.OKI2018_I69.PAR.g11940.t1.cds [Oikopleura dioica]